MTHGPRRARSSLDCRVLGLARWQGPADTSAAPVHLTDPFMSAAHIQRDALASKPKATLPSMTMTSDKCLDGHFVACVEVEAEGVAAPPLDDNDDKCLEATHSPPVSSSHLSLTGYIPTHSPTSPTSTSRAARAHDADLQICRSVPP